MCSFNIPPTKGQKLRDAAASRDSGTPAGASLFGCRESLQTTAQGTRRQLEARPEAAAPAREEPHPLGLSAEGFVHRSAPLILLQQTSYHLPPRG